MKLIDFLKGGKPYRGFDEELHRAFWKFAEDLWLEFEFYWLPVVCPKCGGLLSQKMGSGRLVCLMCHREFKLIEVNGSPSRG